MTKKHFKAIAAIIDDVTHRPDMWCDSRVLANCLADYFEVENPNFDREKWNEACNVFKKGE